MIGELLVGAAVLSAFASGKRKSKTHVEHGRNFFGCRYKVTSGECFSCHGTGTVHGKTCRKCGGSGVYSRTSWTPRRGELYVGTGGVHWGGGRHTPKFSWY